MKSIILFFLCSLSAFSQESEKKSLQVEYELFNNTALPNTLYATLSVDHDVSIYIEKYSTRKITAQVESETIRLPKNAFEPYTRMDHAKKKIFFFALIGSNTFLVEDKYNDLKWSVLQETKDVAGYRCTKAVTNYRGREWVAWFTADIAMPYGPWKLHGLPGLILEASDSTNMYSMKATKVEAKRDEVFNKDFKLLMSHKNKQAISYKEYLDDKEEYRTNVNAELVQKFPNTKVSPKGPRADYELVFEWDK